MAWAIALLALPGVGCDTEPTPPVPPGGVFDLGPVFARDRPDVSHRFTVTNTTDRPVRILGERHSCECTEVTLETGILEPGESFPLSMALPVAQGYGKQSLTTTVFTDHPEFPTWIYELRLESFPLARFVPDRIDLGTAKLGGELPPGGEAWLEVFTPTDAGELAGSPELVESSDLDVDRGSRPLVDTVADGVRRARYRLAVRPRAIDKPGVFSAPISVAVDGTLGGSATVSWAITGPFALIPAHVSFGTMGAGATPKIKSVVIGSNDGHPFRILDVDGGSPDIAVRIATEGTATEHNIELELTVPEGTTARSLAGTARVATDEPAMPAVEIPWAAFLRSNQGSSAGASAEPRPREVPTARPGDPALSKDTR